MKKILLSLLFTCCFISVVFAENITFLKDEYELQYVAKNAGNYINEYVRPSQSLSNWTNIISVHYFPNNSSEKEYIEKFMNFITKNPKGFIIKYFPQYNIFSFGIISMKNNQGYIEYNVMRVNKNSQKGIDVLQFGHKYKFKDEDTFKEAYERCFKYNMKYTNGLLNIEIPPIEKQPYEKK